MIPNYFDARFGGDGGGSRFIKLIWLVIILILTFKAAGEASVLLNYPN